MPRLYLVRHAEPHVDREQAFELWTLTDAGRLAARQLSSEVGPVARVFASDELKALQTAQIIAGDGHVETDPRLREVGGRAWSATPEGYRAEVRRYLRGDEPDGWESARDVQTRIVEATKHIMAAGDDSIIVSHGIALTLLVAWIEGVEPATLVRAWEAMRFPGLCIADWPEKRVLKAFGAAE